MNILFLSHLENLEYAGPTYSVPKQIQAQSKFDNVFWYNAVNEDKHEWHDFEYYHNLNEFPNETIRDLPKPFCNPDLIVVELFYNMAKSKLLWELMQGDIPYIIIPRGELTKQAQARKRFKKMFANIAICKRFAKKAAAIQYLTKQEKDDSTEQWNKNVIVIPNGIDIPFKKKNKFTKHGVKCVFIGRIEPYQKGLDLLIEACIPIKDKLLTEKCTITICGPDSENKLSALKQIVYDCGLSDTVLFIDGVFGEEKEKVLLSSDVFCMPSRFEGHPMALIEALSYGIPCLVTTGSNMRIAVDEYGAGWTADINVKGITNAILKMLAEKDNIELYGIKAAELSILYDWEKIAYETHVKYRHYAMRVY